MDTATVSLQKRVKLLLTSSAALTSDSLADISDHSIDVKLDELITLSEKLLASRERLGIKEEFQELDKLGTGLWNSATALVRTLDDASGGDALRGRMLRVRVLAYYMLDCAQSFAAVNRQNILRLLKVAMKLCRQCLERKQLPLATKVMERAAKCEGELLKVAAVNGGEHSELLPPQLLAEYYTLRMLLAWKSESLSMADYMYDRATEDNRHLADPRVTERVADVLVGIGNELLVQNAFVQATKWLQRAYDVISRTDPEYLSENGTELRLSITYSLAKSLIRTDTSEVFNKARIILELMVEDWPTRIVCYLLQLDLALAESPDNMDSYRDIIMKIISIIQLTEISFKTILRRIHILVSKKASVQACQCIDTFISKRLLPMEKELWMEQAFVTRLWIMVQSPMCQEEAGIASLRKLLDDMTKKLEKPLSPKATHAAQILLWKVSEVMYVQEKYKLASMWCRVALHMVFDKSGELNYAKIARRILLCAIFTKDFGLAAEVFNEMPSSTKDAPFTRFLMFKVALRTSDDDLAMSSLRRICESETTDRRLLYACALDAQENGNRKAALRALKGILHKFDTFPPESCHLPALLRSTFRLTMAEIEESRQAETSIDYLCTLYEHVLDHATRSRQAVRAHRSKENFFDISELDWFTKNGYNLGLRGIVEWAPSIALRILTTCDGLLALYPENVPESDFTEITYRRILCSFLCASLCIEIARGQDQIEKQLHHYLMAKDHVQKFKTGATDFTGRTAEEKDDLQIRYRTLLTYEFESLTRLKTWGGLLSVVDETIGLNLEKGFILETMADMMLCSGAPAETILVILQKLLEGMFNIRNKSLHRLAKWIRCLVQLSMLRDYKVAAALLEQAVELAKNASRKDPYPEEELQWLVAAGWNRSIDFNCVSDTANGKRFAELSLSLANLLENDGMRNHLQAKMLQLNNDR